jgi:NAD(P)-dependent dehydrogenase (short-subunit alcohol dehydrogenase family)
VPLLNGKIVFISGSTRGIGRAMADAFAAEGARVIINGRKQADADAVAAQVPGALAIGGDMADRSAIEDAVRRVKDECGAIHVLVNNAAVSSISAITRLTDEDWDRILRINLTGPMQLTRAVIPLMKAQGGGTIINVISGAATEGTVGYSAYSASKGGLLGLTMTLAAELARFGIRVNALSPSAMTDMLRQNPPEVLEQMADALPSIEAVAGAALFLASDLSSTVTGQIVRATKKFEPIR